MSREMPSGPGYASLTDFHRRGPHSAFLEEIRAPAGAPVSLVDWRGQSAGEYLHPPFPEFGLHFSVTPKGVVAEWDMGTGRRRHCFEPPSFVLTPPAMACEYRTSGPLDLLTVALPAAEAARLLDPVVPGGFAGEFGPLHGPLLDDPFVSGLCERMWEEAAGESPAGRLFLDSAVAALLVALFRRSRRMAGAPPDLNVPPRGGLAPWRLKRALDLLDARLADDIGLDELAAAAGLHPTHFARAFRSSTGASPHRHLLVRRIERAKGLLAATETPLAEVASLCGFADQSHLGVWFRRLAGNTPKRFRDAARF